MALGAGGTLLAEDIAPPKQQVLVTSRFRQQIRFKSLLYLRAALRVDLFRRLAPSIGRHVVYHAMKCIVECLCIALLAVITSAHALLNWA